VASDESQKEVGRWEREVGLNVFFGEPGDFHLRAQQAYLERLVAMDRDNSPFRMTSFEENLVAAFGPSEYPALAPNGTGKILAGNLFQSANSKILPSFAAAADGSPASNQSSIASNKFERTSFSVSP
jgi:hypothetical protein